MRRERRLMRLKKNFGESIRGIGTLIAYLLGVILCLSCGAGILSFFWPFLVIIALIVVWAVRT